MEYIKLPGFEPLSNSRESLNLPRAKALFDAICNSTSFELIGLLQDSQQSAELLVVELSSDEVPNRNDVGIKYLERLGIVVRDGNSTVPEVYPLRRDFPNVSHRNSPRMGFPADLCLYFEPIRSILRTWTAAKFLHRID